MIRFTDVVMRQILFDIGSSRPERGGALLGLPRTNVVCKFISDPTARVTGASYFPSEKLQIAVNEEEERTGLSFYGIVHSHPGDLNAPSLQDHSAFSAGLERNPHISSFVAPIITLSPRVELQPHEIRLSHDVTMSNFVAYRPKRRTFFSSVSVVPETIDIIPIAKAWEEFSGGLADVLVEQPELAEGLIEVNSVHHFTATLTFRDFELILIVPPIYPLSPPTLFVTDLRQDDARSVAIPVTWRGPQSSRTWIEEARNQIVQLYGG